MLVCKCTLSVCAEIIKLIINTILKHHDVLEDSDLSQVVYHWSRVLSNNEYNFPIPHYLFLTLTNLTAIPLRKENGPCVTSTMFSWVSLCTIFIYLGVIIYIRFCVVGFNLCLPGEVFSILFYSGHSNENKCFVVLILTAPCLSSLSAWFFGQQEVPRPVNPAIISPF